jgi:outer membrane protein OmpA-like peptidoglycan-associated protein
MLKALTIWSVVLSVVSSGAMIFSSQALAATGAHKIRGYLSAGADARFVVIEAGRSSGVISGEVFRAVRPAKAGAMAPIETGLLKANSVYEHETIAEVIQQGTPESKTIYGVYGDVMAGDLAIIQKVVIVPAKVLTPEMSVTYSSLFEDPKSNPETFELTISGRTKLREVGQVFAGMKVGMLMIEGHTDQRGDSNLNQIESFQRALTVRQYLIDELGFDENRVTAIGLGESEPLSTTILPGNRERSRRIILKVVPKPNAN